MEEKFLVIAGPCAIESEEITRSIAEQLLEITELPDVEFYFKASFDKANRTSLESFRGPGIERGLEILERIKLDYHMKVMTDIHEPWQAHPVADVCDMIQIPAFLCRQTDLLTAAAVTGKRINIKKAQFLAPWDMANVAHKVEESGNKDIVLCERGTAFGYNRLVVDMTSFYEMKKLNYPVIFDATHSVQKPGGKGNSTSGNREYVPYLARAAAAAGADGLFLETHDDPDRALSDGPNMVRPQECLNIIRECLEVRRLVQKFTNGEDN